MYTARQRVPLFYWRCDRCCKSECVPLQSLLSMLVKSLCTQESVSLSDVNYVISLLKETNKILIMNLCGGFTFSCFNWKRNKLKQVIMNIKPLSTALALGTHMHCQNMKHVHVPLQQWSEVTVHMPRNDECMVPSSQKQGWVSASCRLQAPKSTHTNTERMLGTSPTASSQV